MPPPLPVSLVQQRAFRESAPVVAGSFVPDFLKGLEEDDPIATAVLAEDDMVAASGSLSFLFNKPQNKTAKNNDGRTSPAPACNKENEVSQLENSPGGFGRFFTGSPSTKNASNDGDGASPRFSFKMPSFSLNDSGDSDGEHESGFKPIF
ncbi:unnamed protein product [Cyprideis torosa]|uniref:Uncharacterized protein n=1 Tax=Cyprideis torosa TaxID=163714 RepID=A0A7R8ZU91_9CRUS|nr:unnamed protein product [Cyprideis torosa]CAG0905493.1 unnamed protein product [Cyprideis torosa]